MRTKSKSGVVNLLLLILIVLVVSMIPTMLELNSNKIGLENEFKVPTALYSGVVTIWNVDTFEGGSQNKSILLESASMNYSKHNSGVYFLVRNVSVSELIESVLKGVYPDILSFGYGLGEIVKPILVNLKDDYKLSLELTNSGRCGEDLLALGYLLGGYILVSNEENLPKSNIVESTPLIKMVNRASFDVDTKRGQKHIPNIVVGKNEYINPKDSLKKICGEQLTDVYESESMYQAYDDYKNYNKGVMLLGTQRDLFRFSGESEHKIECLSGFTNLIQYLGITNNVDDNKLPICKDFLKFMISTEIQQLSTKIGMVNVLGKTFYESGEFIELENAVNSIKTFPNLFSMD